MKRIFAISITLVFLILCGCNLKEKPIEGVVVEKASHYIPHRMTYCGKHWIHRPGYYIYRLTIKTDSTTESRGVSKNVYDLIQIGDSIKWKRQ